MQAWTWVERRWILLCAEKSRAAPGLLCSSRSSSCTSNKWQELELISQKGKWSIELLWALSNYSINHLMHLFGRLCCETSPCQPFLLLDAPVYAGLALFYASFRFICSLQVWHHCRKARRKEKKKENSNISNTPSLSVSSHFTCWLVSSVLVYLHGISWLQGVIL